MSHVLFNPLSAKKQTTFMSENFKKKNVPYKLYHNENSKTGRQANSVDLDEGAHNELPHYDLHGLQIQFFYVSGT